MKNHPGTIRRGKKLATKRGMTVETLTAMRGRFEKRIHGLEGSSKQEAGFWIHRCRQDIAAIDVAIEELHARSLMVPRISNSLKKMGKMIAKR